ncbi:hypothetical protein ACROSR_14375 [Roseovarius tibetensis]|uniref:hypothetical protein n=1 Tax=Roseovarius tibetensis TaxID=2685897 RepID=UPI003D7F2F42
MTGTPPWKTCVPIARKAGVGCLRREYFGKDEWERSTLPDARADRHQAPEQGFTFHGRRLSSLYRVSENNMSKLISGKPLSASSFQKYSTPTHTAKDIRPKGRQ